MSAAVRASTSSRSSEELTSSPISASVLSTSAETSAAAAAAASTAVDSGCSLAGFMNLYHYSRQPQSGCESSYLIISAVTFQFGAAGQLKHCAAYGSFLFVWFWRFVLRLQNEHSDSLQIAITLRIVQPKADHEFVGNAESHVIRLHRRDAPFRLVQQYRDAQPLWLALFQYSQEILQRHSGIQNIFNDDDSPAFDARVQIFCESYLPRSLRVLPVARHGNEIKRHLARDSAREIGQKEHRSF